MAGLREKLLQEQVRLEKILSIPGGFTPQFRRLETGVPM